ncbi:hypothetical protein CEUSTIGMA_g8389.t1 [Chlamydomonas eustigma]|uniref:Isocitrate lyase n=1 Tax=Chlamydomonas eustigma TaxID=1157962 RepID=A0A250XCZ4_9CHLO|nr:hypothetical protein CEUSTIGMA_g8389.t1 [Chlamydomonas eustigma]|eukprot:GAX80954.1 hypothetical protein CEUSTIGMA_g8389.t1 [Chlamydomonas eustigma]
MLFEMSCIMSKNKQVFSLKRSSIQTRAVGDRTNSLRKLIKEPGLLKGPCCHDALSAKLIEQAGFSFSFMSGFCTAGARLGAPDTGLITYAEMVDQGRYIMEATKRLPIIGDGDTGYGNALNVKRTVRGYAQAGFAGILIEDQVSPKSCGHVKGKRVVGREEAVSRIRAAVDARNEGADILILARTDARQAESLQEALWRVAAFAEAGADILFVDALESEAEMKAFCRVNMDVPKMANMLEGGGKTPVLSPQHLEDVGYKLVAYPLSLLGVSIRAMQGALQGLKDGRVPGPLQLGTFEDIQAAVGFPEYYIEEARYAISLPSSTALSAKDKVQQEETSSSSSFTLSGGDVYNQDPELSEASKESDFVLVPKEKSGGNQELEAGAKDRDSRRNMYFRVKISDMLTGLVKLETRIPAGFLTGLSALVPAVSGFNIEDIMQRSLYKEGRDPSEPILSTTSGGDRIQIYLE